MEWLIPCGMHKVGAVSCSNGEIDGRKFIFATMAASKKKPIIGNCAVYSNATIRVP